MLGCTSGRQGLQLIQFTEYFLPSLRIFLGCKLPLEVCVIVENVPAQSVRNGFAGSHAQQIRIGLICESVGSRPGSFTGIEVVVGQMESAFAFFKEQCSIMAQTLVETVHIYLF